jgi:hypothetical protein
MSNGAYIFLGVDSLWEIYMTCVSDYEVNPLHTRNLHRGIKIYIDDMLYSKLVYLF